MTERTMGATDRAAAGSEQATATMRQALRHVWLAGLGAAAIAGEKARTALQHLEEKGQQVEPTFTAPLKRAGDAANRVVETAGVSARNVGGTVASLGKRVGVTNLKEQVERVVEEKLATALKRLDVPTRQDFEALKERIDELSRKLSQPGQPQQQ